MLLKYLAAVEGFDTSRFVLELKVGLVETFHPRVLIKLTKSKLRQYPNALLPMLVTSKLLYYNYICFISVDVAEPIPTTEYD